MVLCLVSLFVNEAYLHKRDRELLKQKIHKSKYSLFFFIDFRLNIYYICNVNGSL